MGNRAVIVNKKELKNGKLSSKQLGVYLHWNGGRDSVEAFLKYCELQHFRTPDRDCYGWARLCQVIGNFFGADGGGLSLGIDIATRLDPDNGDNGVYIIEGWKIVGRMYFDGRKEQQYHPLKDMVLAIDEAMPKADRLGEEFISKFLAESDQTP